MLVFLFSICFCFVEGKGGKIPRENRDLLTRNFPETENWKKQVSQVNSSSFGYHEFWIFVIVWCFFRFAGSVLENKNNETFVEQIEFENKTLL